MWNSNIKSRTRRKNRIDAAHSNTLLGKLMLTDYFEEKRYVYKET